LQDKHIGIYSLHVTYVNKMINIMTLPCNFGYYVSLNYAYHCSISWQGSYMPCQYL